MDAAPLPRNYATEALAASIRLRGSIVVYGFTVYNTKASAQYLCMFDADALPADTSIPIFSWPLPANNGVGFGYAPNGRRFDAGLVLCNSSTDAAKTIGSADCLFDVQYDVLDGQPVPNISGGGSGLRPILAIVKLSAHIDDWDGSAIPFNSVTLDPDGLWNAVSHQFVAKTAAWYSVSTFGISSPAAINAPPGGTGAIHLNAIVAGAGDNLHSSIDKSADITVGGYYYPQISGITHLDVGDGIDIESNNGGVGYTVPAGFCFAIQRVGQWHPTRNANTCQP